MRRAEHPPRRTSNDAGGPPTSVPPTGKAPGARDLSSARPVHARAGRACVRACARECTRLPRGGDAAPSGERGAHGAPHAMQMFTGPHAAPRARALRRAASARCPVHTLSWTAEQAREKRDFSSEKAKLFFLLGLRPRERSRPPPCMAAAAGPREARVQRDCTRACSVACGFCTGTGLSLLATASTGRCFESPLSCTIPVSLDVAPLGVGSRRHAWTLGPTLTNSLLNSLIRARCVDDGALGDARGSGHPV